MMLDAGAGLAMHRPDASGALTDAAPRAVLAAAAVCSLCCCAPSEAGGQTTLALVLHGPFNQDDS